MKRPRRQSLVLALVAPALAGCGETAESYCADLYRAEQLKRLGHYGARRPPTESRAARPAFL